MKKEKLLTTAIMLTFAMGIHGSVWAADTVYDTVTTGGGEYNAILITDNTREGISRGIDGPDSITPIEITLSGDRLVQLNKTLINTAQGNNSFANFGIRNALVNADGLVTVNIINTVDIGVTPESIWTYVDVSPSIYGITTSEINNAVEVNLNSNVTTYAGASTAVSVSHSEGHSGGSPMSYGINASIIHGDATASINYTALYIASQSHSNYAYGDSNSYGLNTAIGIRRSTIYGNAVVDNTIKVTQEPGGSYTGGVPPYRADSSAVQRVVNYGIQDSSVTGNANVTLANIVSQTAADSEAPNGIAHSMADMTLSSAGISGGSVEGSATVKIDNDIRQIAGLASGATPRQYANAYLNTTGISNANVGQNIDVDISSTLNSEAPNGAITDDSYNRVVGINASNGDAYSYNGNANIKVDTDGTKGINFYSHSLEATGGSTITLNSDAGTIEGDVFADETSAVNVALRNNGSFLQGNILSSNVEVSMADGAEYRPVFDNRYGTITTASFNETVNDKTLTVADRTVPTLALTNGGAVNMTWDGAVYNNLNITNFTSTDGAFIMNTDLVTDTDGDKIYITNANAGTTYISVKDASAGGGSVPANEHALLLVTDTSEQGTFTGRELYSGGLFVNTPIILNGQDTILPTGGHGEINQWFLTGIIENLTEDAKVLVDDAGHQYGVYLSTMDSLRERLGGLRDRNKENGIWARYRGGKFDIQGNDLRYNMYQVGYDKALNDKTNVGVSIEKTTGKADYAFGRGESDMISGSLYGTFTNSSGAYTDVVFKFGKIDNDIYSYGRYADRGSYDSKMYSLSVEHGRKIPINEGIYIEPSVQLVYGNVGNADFTTDTGIKVHYDSLTSLIGRAGILVGKGLSKGEVYLKANVLHEFKGDRNGSLFATNGDSYPISKDHGGTWVELGVGGKFQLSEVVKVYGDISKSFGGEIKKKWQVNAGVMYEF